MQLRTTTASLFQLEALIHEKAHVDDTCVLGARTKVWQFASLTRGVEMGVDCSVAPCAMLDGCVFGNRVLVGPSVSMGPGFHVGSDVFIGPSVTFCNDAWPRASKEGFDSEALYSGRLTTICVGNGASIGANAVILPGIMIGCRAMVAAGAVVGENVPDDMLFTRDRKLVHIPTKRQLLRMRQAKW